MNRDEGSGPETPRPAFLDAPRCGAVNRAGCPCQAPAMRGKKRCRLHGGWSTGERTEAGLARVRTARWVHGFWSAEPIEERREARRVVAAIEAMLCG